MSGSEGAGAGHLGVQVIAETSAVIAYLSEQREGPAVERILELTEAGMIELRVSDFVWQEVDSSRYSESRLKRFRHASKGLLKIARLGEWQLGHDVLGHDASHEIEETLPKGASREDREQLLSYAAQCDSLSYFATLDAGDFLRDRMRALYDRLGFRVGTPSECLLGWRTLG